MRTGGRADGRRGGRADRWTGGRADVFPARIRFFFLYVSFLFALARPVGWVWVGLACAGFGLLWVGLGWLALAGTDQLVQVGLEWVVMHGFVGLGRAWVGLAWAGLGCFDGVCWFKLAWNG